MQIRLYFLPVVLSFLCLCSSVFAAPQPALPTQPHFRILHIMSFDSPYRWSDGQFDGFKEGLGPGLDVEYKVYQMDTKRQGSPEAKAAHGQEARSLIESWKPDLVYLSDDDAIDYVAPYYMNKPLPIVFSGANKTPQALGISGASNITGVLEEEHFVESVRLLQSMVPHAKRLAVITDNAPYWASVIARIQQHMPELPQTRLVAIDTVKTFAQYQSKLASYPGRADAVVQLGIFNLKDAQGHDVDYKKVHRWTAENNKLPEISFWIDRVYLGVLASVTVSEIEQGRAAGIRARAILLQGKRPGSLPIVPTRTGHPAINLERAQQLGIKIKASLLLSAEVATHYEWNTAQPIQ